MRSFYFVICFSTGVCLMIFSGYVPQAASARSGRTADALAGSESGSPAHSASPAQPVQRTRPRTHAALPPVHVEPPNLARNGPAADAGGDSGSPGLTTEPPAATPAASVAPQNTPQSPAKRESHGGNAAYGPPHHKGGADQTTATPPAVQQPGPLSDSESPRTRSDDSDPSALGPLPTRPHRSSNPDRPAASPAESETAKPAPAGEPPVARAAKGATVWSGWDQLTLDGSGSSGQGLTYHWRQAGGPPLVIKEPDQATTPVTGTAALRPSWRATSFKFELTVTDATGAQDTTSVLFSVRSAPALRLRPAADQRFEDRGGYQLGHFTVWQTANYGAEATFDLATDSELNFSKLTAGHANLTGGKADTGGYAYQITVYAGPGESATWTEFLVNTEEKIPAILQLGVNWEVRADPLPAGS